MYLQQPFNGLPQFGIRTTGGLHKSGPFSGRLRERRLQQLVGLLPLLKSHTAFFTWETGGGKRRGL
jgi:hypothetical protein